LRGLRGLRALRGLRGTAAFASLVVALALLVGCDRGGGTVAVAPVSTVVVTNVVTETKTVTVTNAVTVTNLVVRQAERILSARRTAPYVVSSSTLDAGRLRRYLSDAGARVVECSAGSVALVEATDKTVGALGAVVRVKALSPEEKVSPDVGERVCVTPLSSIDAAAVATAIRGLGGEVTEVVTVGQPRIRAKISYSAIRKLAVRGDVRRIERDGK